MYLVLIGSVIQVRIAEAETRPLGVFHLDHKIMKLTMMIGLVLLGLSGYSLFDFYQKYLLDREVEANYEFRHIYDSNAVRTIYKGHSIALKDAFTGPYYNRSDRVEGPVNIDVDGQNYGIESNVGIRPAYMDANRYFGWIASYRLQDKQSSRSYLAIIQRIGNPPSEYSTNFSDIKFRLVLVGENGVARTEVFSFAERNGPLYRKIFVASVIPVPEAILPTFWYPIFFPIVTGLGGLILTILSAVMLSRGKRNRATS